MPSASVETEAQASPLLYQIQLSCRFTACVATSGLIMTRRIISLQWMAFEYSDLPVMGFAKVQDIPLWTTGTQCVLVDTGYKVKAEV